MGPILILSSSAAGVICSAAGVICSAAAGVICSAAEAGVADIALGGQCAEAEGVPKPMRAELAQGTRRPSE